MRITIKNGWYFSAGRTFHWEGLLDSAGVGINMQTLSKVTGDFLEVMVQGKLYRVRVAEAMEFIGRWRSVIQYRFNDVGVISRSILQPMFKVEKTVPTIIKEIQPALI